MARRRGREPNSQSREDSGLTPRVAISRNKIYMERAPTAKRSAGIRHLRALDGGDREPPDEGGLVRAAQRPGDRHDAWSLERLATAALDQIRSGAVASRVPIELAVSLVVQRALVENDLAVALGDDRARIARRLDLEADTAQVLRPVSPAYAAYVRELTGGSSIGTLGSSVPLPLRIIERIGDAPLRADVASVDVRGAVAWERAAALAGQTMAEWAALTAARLSRS